MPLVNNGLKLNLPGGLVPAGSSAQPVTEFADFEYVRELALNVLKATVEDAAKENTFDNIMDDVTIGVKKQVDDIISADYIDANTVTYFSEITYISSTISGNNTIGDFFTNTAVSYVCSVKVYIKTS